MCTFISAYNRKKMIGPHSNLVYLSNAVSVIIFNRLRNKASCNWFQCLRFKNCLLWDKFESDLFSIEWILLSVSHKCGLIYLHFILFIILIILMKSANWARSYLNHISSCLFGFVMLLNISDSQEYLFTEIKVDSFCSLFLSIFWCSYVDVTIGNAIF